jgi:pimeloyl-ACP methyl ester carboxylesterase
MEYPYSLSDYVDQLTAFMEENKIVFPHVVAHSFGARVAIKATTLYPNLFDRLVLTGAAGLRPKRTLKKTLNKAVFNVAKVFLPREKLTRFYSKDYLALDDVMKESFKKIVSEHLDGLLSEIKNKTFLVFGENDKETPLYMAKRLNAGIKDSKLMVLKNTGHFAFVDKSIKFNFEVREFLLSKD